MSVLNGLIYTYHMRCTDGCLVSWERKRYINTHTHAHVERKRQTDREGIFKSLNLKQSTHTI